MPSDIAEPLAVQVLYSKHEHGGVPIYVYPPPTQAPAPAPAPRQSLGSFTVHWHRSWDSSVHHLGEQTYPSGRQLLRALHNAGDINGPHSGGGSFQRYFRIRRKTVRSGGGALDLFGSPPHRSETHDPARCQIALEPPRGLTGASAPSPSPESARETQTPTAPPTARRRCPPEAGRWYRPRVAAGAMATTLMLFGLSSSAPAPSAKAHADPLTIPELVTLVSEQTPPAPAPPLALDPRAAAPTALGIDLAARGHEVRLLLNAGFGLKMSASGYDPDDVLQEVYRGILARNKGTCPFDPTISSFGHYVHMVCDCVLKNYHRKQKRRRCFETIGVKTFGPESGDGLIETDAALGAVAVLDTGSSYSYGGTPGPAPLACSSYGAAPPSEDIAHTLAVNSLDHWFEVAFHYANKTGDRRKAALIGTARAVLPLRAQGLTRSEIAKALDIPPTQVTKALGILRNGTAQWAEEQGLRT